MPCGGITSTEAITASVVGDRIVVCLAGVGCMALDRDAARRGMSSLGSAICATAPPIDEASAEKLARAFDALSGEG